ncbi:DUF1958 domain-containing protein [Enterococcus viikkiensis]|uniref:DUF1958 domain-containing protein n=1 Tax=Enterococcus viikkiensis TaxID=930854 RepID=UPI0010F7A34E
MVIKKILATAILLCLGSSAVPVSAEEDIFTITQEAGYTEALEINKPKSSIIIDGTNGQILWDDQADMLREPASISKMMTVFLVFDAIQSGKLNLDTKITATETDQAISQLYAISNSQIVAGVDYPVRELVTMVTVPSSNVATVMLANAVFDNDAGAFIQRMNEKAQKIGMKQTIFYNCSGASATSFEGLYTPAGFDPNGSNRSTARDLATMVFHLVKDHPEVLGFTNQPKVTTMAGTPYEESFETYNYSLPGTKYGIEGVDGLKTGSGPTAAFNYIATAKRGDTRLIAVVLGVGDWSDQDGEYYRHTFGNAILEKAFSEYEYQRLLPKGRHSINGKEIQLSTDFNGVVKKDQKKEFVLKDDQLVLKSSLEQVEETLPKVAISYQDVKKPSASKEHQKNVSITRKKAASIIQAPLFLIISLAAGVLFLLGSFIIPTKKKATRSRRHGVTPNRIFRSIGLLCLLSAVVQVLMTILN